MSEEIESAEIALKDAIATINSLRAKLAEAQRKLEVAKEAMEDAMVCSYGPLCCECQNRVNEALAMIEGKDNKV